jgi:hypothetical protein
VPEVPGGIHLEVDHLSGCEWGEWIWKLQRSLNGVELDEGLLNFHLLVEVSLILKKHFLSLTKNIHRLFVALADREQTLEKLENSWLAWGGVRLFGNGRSRTRSYRRQGAELLLVTKASMLHIL